MPPAPQRFAQNEQVTHPLTRILRIPPFTLSGFRRKRDSDFGDQWFTGLVHTDHRNLRIRGPLIHLQNVLQAVPKFGIRLGRNTPRLDQPGLNRVFSVLVVPFPGIPGATSLTAPAGRPRVGASSDDGPSADRYRPAPSRPVQHPPWLLIWGGGAGLGRDSKADSILFMTNC
jgi:hypothetical protein